MIHARGYMVEAEWDGDHLVARGTNKAGQLALAGPDAADGDVVLERARIARVEHKPPRAGGLVNGELVVHTTDGKKYQLHYRKKSAAEFAALAAALA